MLYGEEMCSCTLLSLCNRLYDYITPLVSFSTIPKPDGSRFCFTQRVPVLFLLSSLKDRLKTFGKDGIINNQKKKKKKNKQNANFSQTKRKKVGKNKIERPRKIPHANKQQKKKKKRDPLPFGLSHKRYQNIRNNDGIGPPPHMNKKKKKKRKKMIF